ncbi:hypothetical protein GGI42DRAFT_269809 [Trichoderma sp. SZMC 28013]
MDSRFQVFGVPQQREHGCCDRTAPLWPSANYGHSTQLNCQCTRRSREQRRQAFPAGSFSGCSAVASCCSWPGVLVEAAAVHQSLQYSYRAAPRNIFNCGCSPCFRAGPAMLHVLLDTAVASKRLQQAARPLAQGSMDHIHDPFDDALWVAGLQNRGGWRGLLQGPRRFTGCFQRSSGPRAVPLPRPASHLAGAVPCQRSPCAQQPWRAGTRIPSISVVHQANQSDDRSAHAVRAPCIAGAELHMALDWTSHHCPRAFLQRFNQLFWVWSLSY